MPGKNPQNYERLKNLPSLDAVQVWLEGDFEIEEEPALIQAIQAGIGRKVPSEKIIKILCQSLDDDVSPEDCLDKIESA